MSLNWKEIDAILREAALNGKRIGDIAQPDFEQLLLLLRSDDSTEKGRGEVLRISHRAHRVVLHLSTMDMPAVTAPVPRFMQLARARLRGGIISSYAQYSDQRVVRIAIRNHGTRFALWVRLWSGAANTLLTDEHDTIIDAYLRRPKAGEISGGDARALIWAQLGGNRERLREPYRCEPRAHSYSSYNEMVDKSYRTEDQDRKRTLLVEQVVQSAEEQLRRLERNSSSAVGRRQLTTGGSAASTTDRTETPTPIGGKTQKRAGVLDAAALQASALLLQREGHRVPAGAAEITLLDPTSGTERTIALDPRCSAQQNAQRYFAKYKDERRAEERRVTKEAEIATQMAEFVRIKAAAPQMSVDILRATLKRLDGDGKRGDTTQHGGRGKRSAALGRRFYSHGFTILSGKSATESDQLMRKAVRGNDIWVHARGVTGSSVFICHRKGKSVPLEVLYDAATLAHHFSKARGNTHADVFYTEVKHLRRAKHAPLGTFIPFHDHGLVLDFDEQRLARCIDSQSDEN